MAGETLSGYEGSMRSTHFSVNLGLPRRTKSAENVEILPVLEAM